MIFAHITPAGEAVGLTPEALNKLIDRYERDAPSIYDLDPLDYTVLHGKPDQTPPSAAQAVSL